MNILLDQPMVVELSGPDAEKILHNLTTNHISRLTTGASLETFVTDVRGWVVAHGMVYRDQQERWLLVGQHPNTAAVVAHIDRYIIREKAKVQDLSPQANILFQTVTSCQITTDSSDTLIPILPLGQTAKLAVQLHASPAAQTAPTPEQLDAWERHRVRHFWPRAGRDIWEKCIPQELDRTSQAICFTKGCYLGQETIARLDARGQIQKKLCLLTLDGPAAAADKLHAGDLEVGYLTTITQSDLGWQALGVVRRGHFEAANQLRCGDFVARVTPFSP